METGLKWILETFGEKPKIAWQIDPFGNSAITPSLFSQLGFEGIVLSRVGTTVQKELEENRNSEFIWTGVPIGPREERNDLLAHVLVDSKYQPPLEMKYFPSKYKFWSHPNEKCSLHDLDDEEKLEKCIKLYYNQAIKPALTGTKHNKIFAIWGQDFAFKHALYGFTYIQKFTSLISERSLEILGREINFKFASVEEYFEDVKNLDLEFAEFHGDTLPYIELDAGTFDHWVGYYSSTPILK